MVYLGMCYDAQVNSCAYCDKKTSNPKFCSRSCAAKSNNRTSPKRKAAKLDDPRFCEARRLRAEEKFGYVAISKAVGIPVSTIVRVVSDIKVSRQEAIAAHISRRKLALGNGKGKVPVKNRLIRANGRRCERCKLESWLEEPIALEIHKVVPHLGYIDGNVEILCPNCHSLTDTWRGRGKRVTIPTVEDTASKPVKV